MIAFIAQIKTNKMIQVVITAVICVIVLVLAYFFIRAPIIKYQKRLKADFALSQEKLKEAQELIRRFPNPQKASEEIEKKAEELKEIGATSRQIPRLIQLLALPANKLKVTVISIKPRQDIPLSAESLPPGVNKVYIELILSGSYQTIADYAKALSELSNTVIIERLTMEKNDTAQEPAVADKPLNKTAEQEDTLVATLLISTFTVVEI